MTHAHFLQLIDRIKQRGPQLVSCISSWNGFTTGNNYVVNRHANNTICATDDQGIHTVIDTDSCQHFSGDGWISFDPAADEMAAQSPRERLAHLASYLLNERESFEPGQIVEWIPGLKSSSFDLMYVIEQVEPFVANPGGSPFRPEDVEVLDLRVAFIAGKQPSLLECFVDSRRVQLAKEA